MYDKGKIHLLLNIVCQEMHPFSDYFKLFRIQLRLQNFYFALTSVTARTTHTVHKLLQIETGNYNI